MNKETQIEEMARDLCDIDCKGMKCNVCDSYGCEYRMQAEALYNAGYRKQIEGEWIPQYEGSRLVKCSACGYEYCDLIECGDYCGNCGAKIDGERRSENEG